jgi:CBS domain-containing protein
MNLMSSPVVTVRPGTPATEADVSVEAVRTTTPVAVAVAPAADAAAVARVLLDRHLDAVPVVDGGRLVGIVTRSDVLRTLVRDDADIARDIG